MRVTDMARCTHTNTEDPFDVDAFDDESKKEKVHIRVQLRNGKRSVTHVSGLSPNLPLKKICKALKKVGAGAVCRWLVLCLS